MEKKYQQNENPTEVSTHPADYYATIGQNPT
jgi:hypothetical protein